MEPSFEKLLVVLAEAKLKFIFEAVGESTGI